MIKTNNFLKLIFIFASLFVIMSFFGCNDPGGQVIKNNVQR